jgi:tellurite resistance protein TehA-like permease
VRSWSWDELDAGAFAFAMATGIISIAAFDQGEHVVSDALLATACFGWMVAAAFVARRALAAPRRRPGLQSFALVAATAVIGARFALAGRVVVALALWSTACAAWLFLLARRPEWGSTRGGSLLVAVAAESVSVLAALLAVRWGATSFLAFALAAWLLGLVVYPVVIALLARILSRERRFHPDLWIVMGALAISTLAGSQLLLGVRALHTLRLLAGWLPDVDLAIWAVASALVAPLTVADLRTRQRWRYEAGRWSFVFPLAMFSVASRTLARADGLSFLDGIGCAFFVVALIAWAVVLIGMARRVLGAFRPTPLR